MHRRTLLLDAMGTLITLEQPVARLREALQREFGVDVGEREARHALGAEIAHYRAHMASARDVPTLRALRAACADVLWAALPPLPALARAGGPERVELLLSVLRFSAFPDARPLLERARAAGLQVLVVSNWDVSLPEVLDRVGLGALLDGVVVSAVVGAAKPAPAIFARALELAGAEPGDCLHVGDVLELDVAGARAAGVEAMLLDRTGTLAPVGVRVIRSLAEVPVVPAGA